MITLKGEASEELVRFDRPLSLLLPGGQHVVARVVANTLPATRIYHEESENVLPTLHRYLLNTLDPIVLLLLGRGGHPVHCMLPLHHLALAVSLTGFDDLNTNIEPSKHVASCFTSFPSQNSSKQ